MKRHRKDCIQSLSGQALARLCGCHPSTVSRSGLPRTEEGLYDLEAPEVLDFLASHTEAASDGASDALLSAKIEHLEAQIKVARQKFEQKKADFMPRKFLEKEIEFLVSGMRAGYKDFGRRIYPDDEARAEKATLAATRAVERTIEAVQRHMKEVL